MAFLNDIFKIEIAELYGIKNIPDYIVVCIRNKIYNVYIYLYKA